jgi:hypothetical protein
MPRNLTSEIQAEIASDTLRPVFLMHLGLDSYDLYAWSGLGDLSYDSQTWKGEGIVLSWPNIKESINLVADNISIELSANYEYSIDITDPEKYRGKICKIYIGFLDSVGGLVANKTYQIFSGNISQISGSENTINNTHTVSAESKLVELQKPKSSRYTHQSQLQLFAGDNGLEYAGSAQASLFLSRGETPDQPFSKKTIYGTTKVEGSVVMIHTSGSGSRYLNLVVAFAGHECEAFDQVYLDDRPILDSGVVAGEFVGVVDYYSKLGLDTQAYISEIETELGSSFWDSTYRLRGITYIYLRILYSEDLFGNSAPSVSAKIQGKKTYDPRTTNTVFNSNPALAIRDFLINDEYGFSTNAVDVDDSQLSVAANDCDFLVARKTLADEKRYTINGWIDTADTLGVNLRKMLTSMSGNISYMGGVFAVYAGNYALTSLVASDDDFVTSLKLNNKNLRDSFNGAKGIYRTPDLNWQEEDYPPYQLASGLTIDGEAKWIDLAQPLVTSAATAQRIAKIAVTRSRAVRIIEFDAKLTLLNIRSGDVISLNTEKSDLGSYVYQVRSVILVLDVAPTLNFELLEVASSDYDWDESTEETELTVPESPSDSILAWTLARLASPTGTPASQTFNIGFNVTVSHNESGVTVRYTTNGSEPTESASSVVNGGTVAIGTSSTVLKLKSFQNSGSLTSEVVTYEYTYEAPTDLVPTPVQRWGFNNAASNSGNNHVQIFYGISGFNNVILYYSINGGSSWSILNSDADNGEFFWAHNIPSNWTPSNERAYGTKAGYVDSNQFIMPDKAPPPYIWKYDLGYSTDYVGVQVFGTNATLWRRRRTKSKSGGGWSSWNSWSQTTGFGWQDTLNTRLQHETTWTDYHNEFYVEQSGFQDSVIVGITSDFPNWYINGISQGFPDLHHDDWDVG